MNNAMAHLAHTIRAAQAILGYHVCDVLDPTQPPCAPGGTCYICEDKANTVEGYDSGCVHYELGAAFRAAELECVAQAEARTEALEAAEREFGEAVHIDDQMTWLALRRELAAQADTLAAEKKQSVRLFAHNGELATEVRQVRVELQQAQAEAVAMRETIREGLERLGWDDIVVMFTRDRHTYVAAEWHRDLSDLLQAALSGTAGQAMLDELARLRAFAATLREANDDETDLGVFSVRASVALATLDSKERSDE
jgi:hypothetical protein